MVGIWLVVLLKLDIVVGSDVSVVFCVFGVEVVDDIGSVVFVWGDEVGVGGGVGLVYDGGFFGYVWVMEDVVVFVGDVVDDDVLDEIVGGNGDGGGEG